MCLKQVSNDVCYFYGGENINNMNRFHRKQIMESIMAKSFMAQSRWMMGMTLVNS